MMAEHIYFDESQYIDDEMLEQIERLMPENSKAHFQTTPARRGWIKRHEGAILLVMICLTLLGLYLIMPYMPMILWNLSTPLTHLIGGQ